MLAVAVLVYGAIVAAIAVGMFEAWRRRTDNNLASTYSMMAIGIPMAMLILGGLLAVVVGSITGPSTRFVDVLMFIVCAAAAVAIAFWIASASVKTREHFAARSNSRQLGTPPPKYFFPPLAVGGAVLLIGTLGGIALNELIPRGIDWWYERRGPVTMNELQHTVDRWMAGFVTYMVLVVLAAFGAGAWRWWQRRRYGHELREQVRRQRRSDDNDDPGYA